MSRAVSAATDVAVTASIDHLIAPIINPTMSNNVGIARAISTVTSPRSSRDDAEGTADEICQKALNRPAFENDCEESCETGGGHGRDGVFGGGGSAIVVFSCEEVVCCVHSSIVEVKQTQKRPWKIVVDKNRNVPFVNRFLGASRLK